MLQIHAPGHQVHAAAAPVAKFLAKISQKPFTERDWKLILGVTQFGLNGVGEGLDPSDLGGEVNPPSSKRAPIP